MGIIKKYIIFLLIKNRLMKTKEFFLYRLVLKFTAHTQNFKSCKNLIFGAIQSSYRLLHRSDRVGWTFKNHGATGLYFNLIIRIKIKVPETYIARSRSQNDSLM